MFQRKKTEKKLKIGSRVPPTTISNPARQAKYTSRREGKRMTVRFITGDLLEMIMDKDA